MFAGGLDREGLAIDVVNGVLYFNDKDAGTLDSVPTDGTAPATILTSIAQPDGLALHSSGVLFFTSVVDSEVRRIDTDGNGLTTIVTGASSPDGIALDVPSGHVYWVETNRIRRRPGWRQSVHRHRWHLAAISTGPTPALRLYGA